MNKSLKDLREITVGLSRFSKQIEDTAFRIGKIEMFNLAMNMSNRTPVDTGLASHSWSEIIRSENELSFQLTVPYGSVLDLGSIPGQKPWPSPGPKTTLYNGRIFSSQVADGIGGIVAEVLTIERKGDIVKAIMNEIDKDLKNALGR